MNLSAKLISVVVAVFFVGMVLGAVFGFLLTNSSSTAKNESQAGASYQAGFDAARKLVAESSIGASLKAQENSRNLSGTVTQVGTGTLTVHVAGAIDPFADPAFADRTVIVNGETTITLITAKATDKKTEVGDTRMTIPEFERTPLKAGEIRIGDSVGVFLSEETATLREPTAVAVQVLSRRVAQ